ncbi:MAG: histidinol dehydrogenase [Deltaproteobacteria bacterium]|nr:histidinol dehydrogenase [Deltaproteobacteria bacterium]
MRPVAVAKGSEHRALEHAGGRTISASAAVEDRVRDIVAAVRERGDEAVAELTREIESREPRSGLSYEIPRSELDAALAASDDQVVAALETAVARVRAFHLEQIEPEYSTEGGALRLRVAPLARVGLYVPGGTALYPSSVVMTAVPAVVAGVGEIIMVTPGASRETLAAAAIAGVHRVFEIGGAQAVAALAYGTDSVPRVDKIVGPGNQWVAAAKRQVFGDVDIDSIAGPSEVLIIADDSAHPPWVAADLLAQAEHDSEARPVLVTTSAELADAVTAEVSRQLEDLPRKDIAGKSVDQHGLIFVCQDMDSCIELANAHAPEHLEVLTRDAEAVAERLHTAGAIFVGPYSPEAAGDYLAGPNHVLPTGGAARYASPLGVYDYRKRTSVLAQSREMLAEQREHIDRLATVESLDGHARSVAIRFNDEGGDRPASVPVPLADRLLRPGLEVIEPYHVEHPVGIHTHLHANEMPFALEPAQAEGLSAYLGRVSLHRYPDAGAGQLRTALGSWLGARPDHLVLGNGSDELIALLCSTFARPRGGTSRAVVLFPSPSFSVFKVAALASGLDPVAVALDDRFELDMDALGQAFRVHRPNLAFFARPNNPTGTLWPREQLLSLAADHPDTLIVVDEAYIAYAGADASMRDEVGDNVIVMGTLSKVGLAGARVGFVLAPPTIAHALERARAPYNIGGLNQAAASYLLTEHRGWLEARCTEVAGERQRVAAMAQAYKGVEVFDSAANLLLMRFGEHGAGHGVWSALAERGILVRDLDKPGPLAGCLRVTIGTREENDKFLAALGNILGDRSAPHTPVGGTRR